MHCDYEAKRVSEEYFEWMCNFVYFDMAYGQASYKKLLRFLNSVEFVPIIELDEDRYSDGMAFRYRFGYEVGHTSDYIRTYLDVKPCSVLEMMVALCFKEYERSFDEDDSHGSRISEWFWSMINSLGLSRMNDTNFNEEECKKVIDRFISRKYEPNGKGGLFTLDHPYQNMCNVNIWYQFMWYLNETVYSK